MERNGGEAQPGILGNQVNEQLQGRERQRGAEIDDRRAPGIPAPSEKACTLTIEGAFCASL